MGKKGDFTSSPWRTFNSQLFYVDLITKVLYIGHVYDGISDGICDDVWGGMYDDIQGVYCGYVVGRVTICMMVCVV